VSEVLVLVDQVAGGVRKASLELLTAARGLGEPSAVVFGTPDEAVVQTVGDYGAAKVYAVLGDEPSQYVAVPQAEALAALAERVSPVAVLVSSSPEGKDVAARVAVRLDSGIITDAIAVALVDGTVRATQSVFAGSWLATSEVVRGTPVVTVRPNAVTAEPAPAATSVVETVDVSFSDAARGARITDTTPKQSTGRPDLTDAAVVVAGGRGVGSAEGFAVIEQLADALGGAVGATRAATDLEWVHHDLQVGQTGKSIAPTLYVAAGVSGAIQHRAGMQSSKTIVAFNKDPKAPIFGVADFGVVGDLHQVLPALTSEITRRRV
jgi:electron transfer flavoprotein alpha subunit